MPYPYWKRYGGTKRKYWGPDAQYYRRRAQVLGSVKRYAYKHLGKYDPSNESMVQLRNSKYGTYPYNFSGTGDYKFSKKRRASVGARIGAWVGDRGQAWLKRLTGFGDYAEGGGAVAQPAGPPSIVNKGAGSSVVISHREYIGDIISSGTANTFKVDSFKLNPGDPSTFPWLANIAANFQQYKLNGCVFEFKTTSADALNSVNTALGQIIMATNYNVTQPNFSSKYEMENTEFAMSCKPSSSMLHAIECARGTSVLSELYIAPNGVSPASQPEQFVNFGNFQIATNGMQGTNVNCGELWVSYEVILMKPIVTSVSGVTTSPYFAYSATSASAVSGPVSPNVFGLFDPTSSVARSYYPPLGSGGWTLAPTGPAVLALTPDNVGDTTLIGRTFFITIAFGNTSAVIGANGPSIGAWTMSANTLPTNSFYQDASSVLRSPEASMSNAISTAAGRLTSILTLCFKVISAGAITVTATGGAWNLTSNTTSLPFFLDVHMNEIPTGF